MDSLLLATIAFSLITITSCTTSPIIGILAQEMPDGTENTTFVVASYVKMVEASGAQVVPIFTMKNEKYYHDLLTAINGVVFPGGDLDLTKNGGFVKAGNLIYQYAKRMAMKRKPFPILGVCQGMELISYLENGLQLPLVHCNGIENKAMPLEFIVDYKTTSLFRNAVKQDIVNLMTKNLTANHHGWCLTEDAMKKTGIDKDWRVLTINHDSDGLRFVSSMESRTYPFAAVQFHPEKVPFEWNVNQNNPHTPEAVSANRIFYDWLVREARRSNNSFKNLNSEISALIDNYSPTFTGKHGGYNEEIYYFPKV